MAEETVLVIACGALAREIKALKQLNGWSHMRLYCLDAELHNRPELIPDRVQTTIREQRPHYAHIFVAYADCGTGGLLDKVLAEEGVERLPGSHCYAFFAGLEAFDQIADEEPGSFYLTDFLTRHFERLVIKGLHLDQHPELKEAFFCHYTRLVYLSQTQDAELVQAAKDAADYLGLRFQHIHTGYGLLESSFKTIQPLTRPESSRDCAS